MPQEIELIDPAELTLAIHTELGLPNTEDEIERYIVGSIGGIIFDTDAELESVTNSKQRAKASAIAKKINNMLDVSPPQSGFSKKVGIAAIFSSILASILIMQFYPSAQQSSPHIPLNSTKNNTSNTQAPAVTAPGDNYNIAINYCICAAVFIMCCAFVTCCFEQKIKNCLSSLFPPPPVFFLQGYFDDAKKQAKEQNDERYLEIMKLILRKLQGALNAFQPLRAPVSADTFAIEMRELENPLLSQVPVLRQPRK